MGLKKQHREAVLLYMQALRVLGHTKATTLDIALALNITVQAANEAAKALRSKGVKLRPSLEDSL